MRVVLPELIEERHRYVEIVTDREGRAGRHRHRAAEPGEQAGRVGDHGAYLAKRAR